MHALDLMRAKTRPIFLIATRRHTMPTSGDGFGQDMTRIDRPGSIPGRVDVTVQQALLQRLLVLLSALQLLPQPLLLNLHGLDLRCSLHRAEMSIFQGSHTAETGLILQRSRSSSVFLNQPCCQDVLQLAHEHKHGLVTA